MMTRTGNGFCVHVYKIMISCMRLHENLRRGAGFPEAEFVEALTTYLMCRFCLHQSFSFKT